MMMKNCLTGLVCLVSVIAAPQVLAFDIMEKLGQVKESVTAHLPKVGGPLCESSRFTVAIVQKHRDTVVEKAIVETGCFTIAKSASAVLSYTVTESGIEETASNDAKKLATTVGLATGVPLLAFVPEAVDMVRGKNGIRVQLSMVKTATRKRRGKTVTVNVGNPTVAFGEARSSTDRPSTHLATVRAARTLVQELQR